MKTNRCKNCLKKKNSNCFSKNKRGNISRICDVCKKSISIKTKRYIEFCNSTKKKKRKLTKTDVKESKLYLIKCYSKSEEFLKLGMTTKTIKQRFLNNIPYSYEIIATKKVNVSALLDYEQALHSLFKKHKYKPALHFSGYTECYNLDSKKEIIKFFK